jgi:DNA ligase-1
MSRFGRSRDAEGESARRPLRVFFFDCLFLDDADLLRLPLARRWDLMAGVVAPEALVPRLRTGAAEAAAAFLADALASGHEGVMAKAPESAYAAGGRGGAWLKIKQPRTLDLVVLGAEWGSGRRSGWLSNLHLGARDPRDDGYVMVGKTFKGLTDAVLAWQTRQLLALEVASAGGWVAVRPELVVEIAFNEVQRSPRYPGGVALRFARVRRYRPDKAPAAADTIDQVRALAPGS